MDEHAVCLGCGYDLRGLEEDGACPECGHSVAASREATRRPMSRRELAAVVVRVLALWLAAGAIEAVPLWIGFFLNAIATGNLQWQLVLYGVLPVTIRAVAAALLWWGASPLAARIVPADGLAFAGPGLTAQTWLRIACVVLGLYLLISGLAGLAGAVPAYSFPQNDPLTIAWGSGVRIVAGLLLTLGIPRLTWLVREARSFGTSK